MKRYSKPLTLAILSGLLMGIAFPQVTLPGFGVLCFAAFIPLLVCIDRYADVLRKRGMLLVLYVCFFVFHGLTNWWVSSWQERTDIYLMISGIVLWLFHPFFLMLPYVVLTSIRRRLGTRWLIGLAPLAVSGFEWLHGQTDASYPWLSSGYMLLHTPFAQVAEYVGVYGLSFGIVAINSLVLWALVSTGSRRVHLLATCLGIVAAWSIVGNVLEHSARGLSGATRLVVDLVQPNEDPWDKWADTREQVRTHMRLTDEKRRDYGSPDLVVWCETAIPYMIRDSRNAAEWLELRNWVDSSNIALLTGYADVFVYPPGQAPPSARRSTADEQLLFDVFNAVMLIAPKQSMIPVHRKSMLTPFAERLPFADQLTFAMQWIEWGVGISAWGKGRTREPLPLLQGGKTVATVGPIICIESIYPEVASNMVHGGADVLCIVTNDAWYNGTWGPEQHYDIARMRAIEQRRPVLRCANSGITGLIAPSGDEDNHPIIKPMVQGVARVEVTPVSVRTVYSMLGDPLPILGLIFSILVAIAARFPNFVRFVSTQ